MTELELRDDLMICYVGPYRQNLDERRVESSYYYFNITVLSIVERNT